MDLIARTSGALYARGLSLAEHYVMCAAGYRIALWPDEFIQFAFVAFEGDPRGSPSLRELTSALARLEATKLMTRLTAESVGEDVDRRATATTPEVDESYCVGQTEARLWQGDCDITWR